MNTSPSLRPGATNSVSLRSRVCVRLTMAPASNFRWNSEPVVGGAADCGNAAIVDAKSKSVPARVFLKIDFRQGSTPSPREERTGRGVSLKNGLLTPPPSSFWGGEGGSPRLRLPAIIIENRSNFFFIDSPQIDTAERRCPAFLPAPKQNQSFQNRVTFGLKTRIPPALRGFPTHGVAGLPARRWDDL